MLSFFKNCTYVLFFGRNVFMPVENQNAEKKDTHPDFL